MILTLNKNKFDNTLFFKIFSQETPINVSLNTTKKRILKIFHQWIFNIAFIANLKHLLLRHGPLSPSGLQICNTKIWYFLKFYVFNTLEAAQILLFTLLRQALGSLCSRVLVFWENQLKTELTLPFLIFCFNFFFLFYSHFKLSSSIFYIRTPLKGC